MCHGVHLLACVSWCVLGLCVMVLACDMCWLGLCVIVLACVCVSWCVLVALLNDMQHCPIHLNWGRVSMVPAPLVEGLEMYFLPPPSLGSTVEATGFCRIFVTEP